MFNFFEPLLNGSGFMHRMGSWSCPWFYGHFGMFGMLVLWLVIILVVAGLVYGVLKLLGCGSSVAKKKSSGAHPLEVLKSRLAEGEISDEEFERKKEKLKEENQRKSEHERPCIMQGLSHLGYSISFSFPSFFVS